MDFAVVPVAERASASALGGDAGGTSSGEGAALRSDRGSEVRARLIQTI